MRKCFACEQMSAVVTITKKSDGNRGYICPICKAEGKDPENDWYYWTKNQYAHFIQFRLVDNKVATATIFPLGERFVWKVNGPCWSTYKAEGIVNMLDMAKQAVDERVMKIIEQEFKPEYVHPMG